MLENSGCAPVSVNYFALLLGYVALSRNSWGSDAASGDAIRISRVSVPVNVKIDLDAKFWEFGANCS